MKARVSKISAVFLLTVLFGCQKKDDAASPVDPTPVVPPSGYTAADSAGPLKSATSIPIGFAVNYNSFMNHAAYRNVVLTEASSITFENEMKHNAIVQNNGAYNFTVADAMVNSASATSIHIFGHVLGWHSQQNATWLKNYAEINTLSTVELVVNNGFESGLVNWSVLNVQNGATIAATNVANEMRTGAGGMKVVNPTANPDNQWRVQAASTFFTTTSGRQYTASYWVRASEPGGSIRLSTQTSGSGSAQYQANQAIGNAWQQVTWTFTANASETRLLLDMGQAANTYYIDDVSVKEVVTSSGTQVAAKLDTELNRWISAMVSRYAGKVKAWDVINELFTETGHIRNNANTPAQTSDIFVWSEYLGREFAVKAFHYAKAADPNALLFINDYNLETTSTAKLDSLVAFVRELQSKGVKIDGIGTQMHTSINASQTAIDNMFKKLAATGLKVRISELDIRVNPNDRSDFTMTSAISQQQADMYKYIISSYLRHVPATQQYGVTFWGVDDAGSWIVQALRKTDFPLLFDKNFIKKPAYAGVVLALKGK